MISVRAANTRETPSHLGWLGRLWIRGADCPPEVAAAGLNAMRAQTYGMTYGMTSGSIGFVIPAALLAASGDHLTGLLLGIPGIVMSGVGLWMPGYWLRRVCRPPVSADEVKALLTNGQDDLEAALSAAGGRCRAAGGRPGGGGAGAGGSAGSRRGH